MCSQNICHIDISFNVCLVLRLLAWKIWSASHLEILPKSLLHKYPWKSYECISLNSKVHWTLLALGVNQSSSSLSSSYLLIILIAISLDIKFCIFKDFSWSHVGWDSLLVTVDLKERQNLFSLELFTLFFLRCRQE